MATIDSEITEEYGIVGAWSASTPPTTLCIDCIDAGGPLDLDDPETIPIFAGDIADQSMTCDQCSAEIGVRYHVPILTVVPAPPAQQAPLRLSPTIGELRVS